MYFRIDFRVTSSSCNQGEIDFEKKELWPCIKLEQIIVNHLLTAVGVFGVLRAIK